MDILAMLQFMIGVGIILVIIVWLLYAWLKKTGRLNGKVTFSGSGGEDVD